MTISFDAAMFLLRFPAFQGLSAALLQLYFNEACVLLDPAESSVVKDATVRQSLLYLLTAHIAQVNQGLTASCGGQSSPALVGRVTSASQGSVSVSTDFGSVTSAQAWYAQTPYGAQYWVMSAKYRSLRYVR